jgi:hypothetical protein
MPTLPTRKRYTPLASPVNRDAHDRCTVPGCIRRPHHWGAALCTKHADRAARHGHVEATTVTKRELAQFYLWVDRGLDLYRDTRAVRVALERAKQLLNFSPASSADWEMWFAGCMSSVRAKPGIAVDARRVLITVLTFFAFEAAYPERVPNTDARDIGLSRSLVRLAVYKQPRPKASLQKLAGRYIAEQLGAFAIAFLDLLKQRTRADNTRREREEAALRDFGSQIVTTALPNC